MERRSILMLVPRDMPKLVDINEVNEGERQTTNGKMERRSISMLVIGMGFCIGIGIRSRNDIA